MRFAQVVFMIAGIYGLIVMTPQYFLEAKTSQDFPPAITHPESYYGFIGVTIAWQVLISRRLATIDCPTWAKRVW